MKKIKIGDVELRFVILNLEKISDNITENINLLLRQLSPNCPEYSRQSLEDLLTDKYLKVLAVFDERENKIIGIGSILFRYMLSARSAGIGDIVVDASYRNKGIGEELIKQLLDLVKASNEHFSCHRKVTAVSLTSHSSRERANYLYTKLGFKIRETNLYNLSLQ